MNPYADTADVYWAAGWRGVLPLPYRAKKNPPAGFTGSTGTDPAYPDVATWMADGDRNICLRLPGHVIGIDVDAYGDKTGALTLKATEEAWGPLPATWRSTSRDDGISGIRLFRIPVGLKWPGEVGPGIETVRRDHRYVVCSPSVHPETGDTYRWIDPNGIVSARAVPDPDTLPYLPDAWVEGLTGGEAAVEVKRNSMAQEAAMLWIAGLAKASEPPCDRMDKAALQAGQDLHDHSAHQTALAAAARLLRLGDEGHAGIVDAIVRLRNAFITEVTRPERKILKKTVRSKAEALAEWEDILISGVNFISADPLGLPVCDCDGLLTEHIVNGANTNSDTADDDQAEDTAPRFPQMVDGATFILNAPELPPAIWGHGEEVFWSEGESVIVVGPPGVGKTTLGGQVVRARLKGGSVLGYGVTPTDSKVLYLAMDRPSQIARSLRRHFTEDDRDMLAEKLVVWKGPPPSDVAKNTGVLVSLAKLAGADTLVVDSIKDAAIGLSNDEVGAAYNQARQLVLAAGVQMLELHHLVKRGPNGAKPTQLADVYGSTWITSGAGSVLLIWGQPGDYIVELSHLKQPANDVGPMNLEHDHSRGITTVYFGENQERSQLEQLLDVNATHGLTQRAAAVALFSTDDPTENQQRKARDKLDGLVSRGIATKEKGGGRGHPSRWFPSHKPDSKPDNDADGNLSGLAPKPGNDTDSPHKKPDNKPDKTRQEKGGESTMPLGMGLVSPGSTTRCESCNDDTGYAAARYCKDCADKRAKGAGL